MAEGYETKSFTPEAPIALRMLNPGILLYSATPLLPTGCACVSVHVCMCVHVSLQVFSSALSSSATSTQQMRNSNCKIISSTESTFYPFALEALRI